jgi:hypothetical protein
MDVPATPTEIADHLGISVSRVSDLVKAGVIPKGACLDAARAAYIERLRESAQGRQAKSESAPRRRKLAAQARIAEMQAEQMAGRLGDLGEIGRVAFEEWRANRDRWMNWPQRVAPEMAAEFKIDAVALAVALERRVRQHLEEISRDMLERSKTGLPPNNLAGDYRDALLAWPARVSDIIAALLGVDARRLQLLLEQHVREFLETLSRPEDAAKLN